MDWSDKGVHDERRGGMGWVDGGEEEDGRREWRALTSYSAKNERRSEGGGW